jgi:hypothetical protein
MLSGGSRRTSRHRAGSAALAIAFGVLLLPAMALANGVGGHELLPRPAEAQWEYHDAVQHAPFELQQPTSLPAGFELYRVSWLGPGNLEDATSTSVDTWFRHADGALVHIWQSNIPPEELQASNEDPMRTGEATSLGGRHWQLVVDHPWFANTTRVILSTRLPDGTTLSLDGPNLDALTSIAETIATEPMSEAGQD